MLANYGELEKSGRFFSEEARLGLTRPRQLISYHIGRKPEQY